MTKSNQFSINLSFCYTKDVPEIQKSFDDAVFVTSPLTDKRSLILIAVKKLEADKIDKVLRLFETESFTIPEDLPQNPFEANTLLQNSLNDKRKSQSVLNQEIELSLIHI